MDFSTCGLTHPPESVESHATQVIIGYCLRRRFGDLDLYSSYSQADQRHTALGVGLD